MARAGSWKLVQLFPLFLNRYRSFLFSWALGTGILESGNCDHFAGTVLHVCTFPATRKALATLQGPRRAQRLGQSARRCSARRGRLGIASEHARILAAPADAVMRGALKVALLFAAAVTFSAVMDMLRSHFRTIGFARRLPSQQAQARYRQWLAL
jgi:hypothetical protein